MLMSADQPAGKPTEAGTVHGFSVSFRFPVSFTRRLWDRANPLFVDTVCRLEPDRTHRILIAIDDQVAAAWPSLVEDIRAYFLAHPDRIALASDPILVVGGEAAKNDLKHALSLLKQMNDAGMDRQSFVVAIGGGAVLDVVSFAAAIAHRGIRTIRVPTTVLAQADSGVAVKNSVNLFDKKNFAGTFAPPFAVLNDFDFLDTLDRAERIAGIAEAVKVAVLRDPGLFDYIESHAGAFAEGDREVLAHVVQRSAELHLAHICGNGDPFELGSARPLDFGHWAAHKLESMTGHRIGHGDAVAIGMALDVLYAVRMGFLGSADAERILRVLEAIGFRLWDAALVEPDAAGGLVLLAGLREFREHLGGELHITMLRRIGDGFEVTAIDERAMVASLQELGARASRAGRQPRVAVGD